MLLKLEECQRLVGETESVTPPDLDILSRCQYLTKITIINPEN